jgi:hypothetical protein
LLQFDCSILFDEVLDIPGKEIRIN